MLIIIFLIINKNVNYYSSKENPAMSQKIQILENKVNAIMKFILEVHKKVDIGKDVERSIRNISDILTAIQKLTEIFFRDDE